RVVAEAPEDGPAPGDLVPDPAVRLLVERRAVRVRGGVVADAHSGGELSANEIRAALDLVAGDEERRPGGGPAQDGEDSVRVLRRPVVERERHGGRYTRGSGRAKGAREELVGDPPADDVLLSRRP